MVNEIAQTMITSVEGAVLATKLDHLKEQMTGISSVMEKMQATLSLLATIEAQQRDFRGALDRAFAEIKIERDKLGPVLTELPQLRSMRRWVIGLALACLGTLGAALFSLLVVQPLYRGYGQSPPTNTFIVPSQPK